MQQSLVIENHTRAFTWEHFDFDMAGDVFTEIVDRLRDTPVGVMFDTANPLVAGEDPLALFARVHDRVSAVHLNDVARSGVFSFVPLGTGIAPVQEVLTRLKQQGYGGWVGIEEASETGLDGFRQAVSFARRAWEAIPPSVTSMDQGQST